jgi:hypothetical protein
MPRPSIHALCHTTHQALCHMPLSEFIPSPIVCLQYLECFSHCFQCIASFSSNLVSAQTSESIALHRVEHYYVIVSTSVRDLPFFCVHLSAFPSSGAHPEYISTLYNSLSPPLFKSPYNPNRPSWFMPPKHPATCSTPKNLPRPLHKLANLPAPLPPHW